MKQPEESGAGRPESEPAAEPKPRKKKRRPREEETEREELAEAADESTESEVPPELTETERREIVAEANFQERVALQEVADRLSPELYRHLEAFLTKLGGRWNLEKGRHVFTRLTAEREVPVADTRVDVEHRYALSREQPPVEPEVIEAKIAEVLEPDSSPEEQVAQLEAVQELLPDGDEVRISISEGEPPIIVTSDEIRTTEAPSPQPSEIFIDPVRAEAIGREVVEEPDEAAVPEPAEPNRLRDVIDILERHAVELNELPPIAGGAEDEEGNEVVETEAEEALPEELEQPEEMPPIPEEPEEQGQPFPEAPPRPRRTRRSRKKSEFIHWEPGWPEVIVGPDEHLKRKARKLIRRLAAEYNLRLTPDLEAYLLAILLRPAKINGRTVFSIGLNLERLIQVIDVLVKGGFAKPRT